MLNAMLFLFNMLPLPPLAGASAIGGILPERAALAVRGFLSKPRLLGIFVAWQVFPYFVDPFFGALPKVVHPADVYE